MDSPNVTVVGLQWGDEGKGKVVDALASKSRFVSRYCGGANAGHTISVGGETFAVHLIPCGMLHEGVMNVVGNGVAFDPAVAIQEIHALRDRGVKVGAENLSILHDRPGRHAVAQAAGPAQRGAARDEEDRHDGPGHRARATPTRPTARRRSA